MYISRMAAVANPAILPILLLLFKEPHCSRSDPFVRMEVRIDRPSVNYITDVLAS